MGICPMSRPSPSHNWYIPSPVGEAQLVREPPFVKVLLVPATMFASADDPHFVLFCEAYAIENKLPKPKDAMLRHALYRRLVVANTAMNTIGQDSFFSASGVCSWGAFNVVDTTNSLGVHWDAPSARGSAGH
jgi:hypothetical protein